MWPPRFRMVTSIADRLKILSRRVSPYFGIRSVLRSLAEEIKHLSCSGNCKDSLRMTADQVHIRQNVASDFEAC